MTGRPSGSATTVATWLADARTRLGPTSDEARLEAELLLRHVTGRTRAALVAWPDATLDPPTLGTLESLLARRLDGEPLAHVLGTREFWSLELEVSPAVLIPRPDTETLVERALAHLASDPDGLVVEAGTGSGAIAIALASECPNPIVATDRSAEALAVAARNASRHPAARRVRFVRGDWLEAFAPDSASLLVSNPPYLADDDPHLPALAREPRAALVAGRSGLEALASLVRQAARVARPGAVVLLEHGAGQGEAVRALFERDGYANVHTTRDLGGRERVSEGTRA